MVADDAGATIPSIDFTNLANNKAEISKQLISAAIDVGFFHVTGKQRHNTARQQRCGKEMLSVRKIMQVMDFRKTKSTQLFHWPSGQLSRHIIYSCHG